LDTISTLLGCEELDILYSRTEIKPIITTIIEVDRYLDSSVIQLERARIDRLERYAIGSQLRSSDPIDPIGICEELILESIGCNPICIGRRSKNRSGSFRGRPIGTSKCRRDILS